MFDGSLPEVAVLSGLDDAALVAAAGGWAQVENAACARKMAVMAELFARRTGCDDAQERQWWWVDPQAAVGAEIGAAQNISQWLALAQTQRGVALLDRLPRIFELFAAGRISDLVVRAIVMRTELITDPEALAAVDAALAAQVLAWGPLSAKKTEAAIDALVVAHDPGALRQGKAAELTRSFDVGHPRDAAGFSSVWGRLLAPDAAALNARIDAMARMVCPDDPRTLDERRADAAGALGAGLDRLACQCGGEDCAAPEPTTPATTVIHVVADPVTLAAAQAPEEESAQAEDEPETEGDAESSVSDLVTDQRNEPGTKVDQSEAPEPEIELEREAELEPEADAQAEDAAPPAAPASVPPAFVIGGGVLPVWSLRTLLNRPGPTVVRELHHPGDGPAESGYRPSVKLAEFIRCRDLTCRFPGCDRPATGCDIDHTVPYPAGATHPANLKSLCRFHHLLKTFWTGPAGWRDRQLPDGTIIWTAPTGHTYTTRPGSALLFPTLCAPTAPAPPPDPSASTTSEHRGAMMPKRRRTRAQNRADRIRAERRLNDDLVEQRNKPPLF